MTPAKPLVSICTVTHNRQHLLPLLQECIREQTYPHDQMEWVIVDDSTDRREAFQPDPNLDVTVNQIRLPEKLRLGAKRNTSHDYCRGDVIVYMDDDDWYPPTRVEHAVERLSNSEALIAGSTYLPVLLLPEREVWLAGPYHQNHATANTFAFKRELLSQTQYDNDSKLAEEKEFLKNFSLPMVQLEPSHTVLCMGHATNSFDKRNLQAGPNQTFFQHITSELWASEKLNKIADCYADALRIKPAKPKLVFIGGPWGSGSSAIAEALHALGLQRLNSYSQDCHKPNSASRQTQILPQCLQDLVDEASLKRRATKQRIEQVINTLACSLNASRNTRDAETYLLQSPIAALMIQEISQKFELRIVTCLRPLDELEQLRERHSWPSHHGRIGAEAIYGSLFTHIVNQPTPVHLVHHDNLLNNPSNELTILAKFLDLKSSPDRIEATARIMQNLEKDAP